ncbi:MULTISPECIES: RNA polymerase-binding protein DksA [Acidithiobacillus]|jgi:DnaK suppressor protein|nr:MULTISPECIES: RNA polymerase-binding protein DksA [Acidithiobacillus]AIA55272.1 C4-type zinc finger protein, DksA/TraR family [Acidithiobacillus caldus ATCC 51756]AUW32913.1 RNA polymerase-binding protein DksA [Acidithiobacillus caldus]MBU2730460.1 RNA polymerase-binding protein DksA [Acidithiobacillus caldus]MBU2735936.1 RNA polymerase-binding protein DksA [Acidithiobacillus caldus ATCC 51756]MBU2743960.1 RNA polymerase-binding protein DksA [Acidithiobacillus caldus]
MTDQRSTPVASPSSSQQFTAFNPYQPAPNEPYMSPAQLAHFRKILEDWRDELMTEVERTVQNMQVENVNYSDPNDRASLETDMGLELRARDRERKLIRKINQALARIDAGEYGYCESCGVEIGLRRLEARPTATLCIDCKTLEEKREKQMAQD